MIGDVVLAAITAPGRGAGARVRVTVADADQSTAYRPADVHPAWSPPPASEVHTLPVGADPSAWIAAQAPGSTLALGTVEVPILLQGRRDLTLRFDALRGDGSYARMLTLQGCERICVEGGTIDGAQGTPSYVVGCHVNHGLDIQGSTDIVVRDLVIRDVWGDFVRLGSWARRRCERVLVARVTGERCGRQGMALVAADHVHIDDCTLGGISRSAIDLEPGGANDGVRHVGVTRLRLGTVVGHSSPCLPWATAGDGVSDVTFDGVHFAHGMANADIRFLDGRRLRNWRMLNFTWEANPGQRSNSMRASLRIENLDGLTIDGWRAVYANVSGQPNQMAPVRLKDCTDLTIGENMALTNAAGFAHIDTTLAGPITGATITEPGRWLQP